MSSSRSEKLTTINDSGYIGSPITPGTNTQSGGLKRFDQHRGGEDDSSKPHHLSDAFFCTPIICHFCNYTFFI